MNTKRRLLWWIVGSLSGLLCIGLILAAYWFEWPHTGFQGKTVWDWLQLLIIPLVLALAALFFNQANSRTERQLAMQRYEQDQEIALDKQREDLLQTYLDRLSELLLKEELRVSPTDAEVRKVARTRTISILVRLDIGRVGYVFAFLREAGLIDESNPIIDLKQADLYRINWSHINLREVNLKAVNLKKANLYHAHLNRANLREVNLSGADLSKAELTDANLRNANLRGANLSLADLNGADLSGADLSGAKLDKSQLTATQIADATF